MANRKGTEPNEKWINLLTDDTEEEHSAKSEEEEKKGQTEKRKGRDEGFSEPCNRPDPPVFSTNPNPGLIESPFPVVSAPSALSQAEMYGLRGDHPPEEQQYHLWQNLDTGEYQYRPVRVGQPPPPPRIANRPLASPQMQHSPQRGLSNFARPLQGLLSSPRPSHRIPLGGEQGKKQRTTWSGPLQIAFENAVDELGPNATPNPIRERLHGEGFDDITREQVSSHLQKYKFKQHNMKQKEQSGSLSESKKEDDEEEEEDPKGQDSPAKSK